jgi:hypothetical protein
MFNFLKTIFIRKTSPYDICVKTIRRLGYIKDEPGYFVKNTSEGRTCIWISDVGIKIKAYGGGYGESDFLPAPLPDSVKLKKFIRENEL